MTGGLCFEALNNGGDLETDMLVILNDNVMSINESTGAVSSYLNRLLTAPMYHRVKDDIEDLLDELKETELLDQHLPRVKRLGGKVIEKAYKLKTGIKNLIMPSMLFEELGFTYYGPVPGHDLDVLIPMLEKVKGLHGPILLHVISHKGKGFEWSENHPEKYHGAKAGFDPETGKLDNKPTTKAAPSWTEVFADELLQAAEKDEKIVAFTAAMPSGTGLLKFREKFPKRFYDVGIAEGHCVVAAAGMAAAGMKPVVAIYSTFLQRAIDMMIHDVAIQKLPVFFCLDRAGIVGDDGETHQGVFDTAYIRMIPNFTAMAPKDDQELRAMIRYGLNHDGPISVRYGRGSAAVAKKPMQPLEHGKAEIMREGNDLYILAFGPEAYQSLEVAEELEEVGYSVGVVNMRFIKPMDGDLVRELAQKTGRIVTYEEGVLMGGASSGVLEIIADAGITAQIRRIGIPDQFVEHGKPELVKPEIHLTKVDLKKAVLSLLEDVASGVKPSKSIAQAVS